MKTPQLPQKEIASIHIKTSDGSVVELNANQYTKTLGIQVNPDMVFVYIGETDLVIFYHPQKINVHFKPSEDTGEAK